MLPYIHLTLGFIGMSALLDSERLQKGRKKGSLVVLVPAGTKIR